ncbi:hypothetical protein [Latilactobacillus curvatus]|uniref:hypothetical protein n=1 Tax=Latilactobacillus curvatus TaxID=28038 RepID=UPI00223A8D67|nr:hypothetical protein [Latilactobacillus curvatus]MCS8616349.1 hypothetical protein [Latilactobacillus curvatus]
MTIDDFNLTNDAKFLLSKMYAQYISARNSGKSKPESRMCATDISELQESLMPEWSDEDILDTCFELRSKELIYGFAAGDTLSRISLTTDAIAVLEVSFKDKLDTVLDYATKIKGLIPFI